MTTNPSHIGQYRIIRKIGAGGMGMVFLGEHTLLGRRAAIKTLLPTRAVNPELVERFFNEARATSAISDPGVIQIFDFGYHVDGTAYIVMELLEGEALSARITRLGKLSVADALRIARQITASLAVAHACEIVHRDLKPENIFLVRDAEAQGGERTKVLDFGICKVSGSDVTVTQVGAMVGTPVYMSPEQCRGAGDVDHRADIYAFGCLLFHMLTGRPPFVGESSGDLIVAHMQADPPAPSIYVTDLPFAVDAVVLRCLAKSAAERYQSMGELTLALGDIFADLEHTESTVAAAPAAMPLGRGFQSVYDANLTAAMRGSWHESPETYRRRPQLQFVSTPPPTPAPDLRDSGELGALRPRRTGARALVAGVLLLGVAAGVVGTWITRDDDGNERRAEARSAVAKPVELDRVPAVPAAPIVTPVAPAAEASVPPTRADASAPVAPEPPAAVATPQPRPAAATPASPEAPAVAAQVAPEPGPAAAAPSAPDTGPVVTTQGTADPAPAEARASSEPAAGTAVAAPSAAPAVTVQRTLRPAGSGAASVESRGHGIRELRRKPKTTRPQPRTAAESTPSSPTPTEDLYDTR